jgi:hypothetical protein
MGHFDDLSRRVLSYVASAIGDILRRISNVSRTSLGTDTLKSLKAPIAPLSRVLKFPVVLVSNILCLILFGCHKARCAGIFYLFEG